MDSSFFALSGLLYQLINYLVPSNDPAIIALVNTAVVVLVPLFYDRVRALLNVLLKRKKEENTVTLREYDGHRMDDCLYYMAVAWFLSDKLIDARHVVLTKTDFSDTKIWPEGESPLIFEYEGHKIKALFLALEDGEEKQRIRVIELSSAHLSANELKNIVQSIQKRHIQHKELVHKDPNYRPSAFQLDGSYWDSGVELVHNKRWSNVVLDEDVKKDLKSRVETFLNAEEWYSEMGLTWMLGLLFSGPPGTGKTSCIKMLSHEYRLPVYILTLSRISDDEMLSNLFRTLPPSGILVIEDIDCACPAVLERSNEESKITQNSSKITLSQLLQNIDGILEACGRIIIMTTNYPERLDSALTRSRRIDAHYQLGPCTKSMLNYLFKRYIGREMTKEELGLMPERKITPADAVDILISCRDNAEKAVKLLQHHCKEEEHPSR